MKSTRQPVKVPRDLNCWTCVDRYYFQLVMRLDAPKVYFDAKKAEELHHSSIEERFYPVRAAGGLK